MTQRRVGAALVALAAAAACSSDGDTAINSGNAVEQVASSDDLAFVADVREAIEAVESDLGGPQRYFEVTANPQLTNIFVAVDDATAAVAYLYVDGELQPPAPKQTGASGNTFAGSDVDFDEDLVASRVADELPNTSINALSVYGDGVGATYVIAGRSEVGGLLDIVVTAGGTVVSVDPV